MPRQRSTRAHRLLVTTIVVTAITLSTALAAFSSAGLASGRNNANFREELQISATTQKTAPADGSNSAATRTGQKPQDLAQQLEKAPDIVIQFDNSSDAPLVLNAASVRAVKASTSDPGVPPNRYWVSPDVVLQNSGTKRVTGLVLCFACGCGKADKTCTGEGGLDLTPGSEYRFKMKPLWDTFTLDGDPNRLKVSVAAVILEGEDLWVNVNETGVRVQGTRAVRSDRSSSTPPSSSEAESTGPDEAVKSEPRTSIVPAKTVSDAACVGFRCQLGLIKNLGEIIGLPVVFEASVEMRLQSAGALYLRNLRRGDLIEIIMRLNNLKYSRAGNQLNVQDQDAPETVYRLNLSN